MGGGGQIKVESKGCKRPSASQNWKMRTNNLLEDKAENSRLEASEKKMTNRTREGENRGLKIGSIGKKVEKTVPTEEAVLSL